MRTKQLATHERDKFFANAMRCSFLLFKIFIAHISQIFHTPSNHCIANDYFHALTKKNVLASKKVWFICLKSPVFCSLFVPHTRIIIINMEPTLQSVVDSNLQWIFVGGKGGVGKTTTSCSLSTLLARTPFRDRETGVERERRVLIISTDPAHNLSDAFDQKFSKVPTPVNGLPNLYGMEVDPSSVTGGEFDLSKDGAVMEEEKKNGLKALGGIIRQAANTLPGIDEVTVFSEIMRNVKTMAFDVVVFDTAPTGHTLRLLALPQTLNTTLDNLMDIKGLGSLMAAASTLMTSATGYSTEDMQGALNKWRSQIKEVQQQFTDNTKTAFVCVCIPEFLSVYETERLIQELTKYNIGCDSIVVNQLVLKPSSEAHCRMCESRKKIQGKYLGQIDELYEDFHVVKMPLLGDEVRGVAALTKFSKFLVEPYHADTHGYL